VTAEQNIHFEDPVSTKIVQPELHKSNIRGKAAVATTLITENNAQMRKLWCQNRETWTSYKWVHARDVVRQVVLHAVSYVRKRLRLQITQGSIQSGMPVSVPTVKHWEVLCWFVQQYRGTLFCWSHY
jgi:hypothetical protein